MSITERKFRLLRRLTDMGFTYEEAQQLRRIEMTLQRWAELECGVDGSCPQSTLIVERDEKTGKPSMRQSGPMFQGRWMDRSWTVPDREKGALKRLTKIIDDRNSRIVPIASVNGKLIPDSTYGDFVFSYHQSDPRGCALYIVRESDLNGSAIDANYTRGIAVCD